MKILLACEESQAVCILLRNLGHEAFSCDIQECSGGHPEWHICGDVIEQLDKGWDMMIAFPPCTHLAVSGARHFAAKIADGRQQEGIDFEAQKTTCLWLKNLPKLYHNDGSNIFDPVITHVGKGEFVTFASGKKHPKWYADAFVKNKLGKTRSKTFPQWT